MATITSHLDTQSKTYRENRDALLEILDMLDDLHQQVEKGGGEEAMARIASQGKKPVRQRIAMVLDRDSPFMEVCPLAAYNSGTEIGSGFIVGIGVISDTECLILGHDPSVRAGAMTGFNSKKLMRGLEIARVNRLPYVQFVESAGGDLRGNPGGPRGPRMAMRRMVHPAPGHFAESGRLFYEITELSQMHIPTVAVVCGTATAGGAYQPGMSDYNIFVSNQARVALGGVPLVKMATGEDADAESLSGAAMHTSISGLGDYLAENEEDGARLCREVISHINWRKLGPGPSMPADPPAYDPDELLGIVPQDLKKPFDMREVIARIVDGSRFEEFKPLYGPTLVCGWTSVDGYPVGVLGNNGPLMSESSEKAAQFVQLCNQIDVPLVFLHNVTGYMVGTDFERGGMIKNGAKMINAVANSTVPHISVIVGASYGAANHGMSGRSFNTRFTFSWPTARADEMGSAQLTGVMGIVDREQARANGTDFDEEAYSRDLDELAWEADERAQALYITAAVADDGLIDPRDTRTHLSIALSACHSNEVAGAKNYGVWRM
jgi:acetyl-CoA carboxylase carboxyltransferase component|tara:strand:- start:11238 stop:12887 length:1650 start_codon:yes stop_codon:yes gene_type:complete